MGSKFSHTCLVLADGVKSAKGSQRKCRRCIRMGRTQHFSSTACDLQSCAKVAGAAQSRSLRQECCAQCLCIMGSLCM